MTAALIVEGGELANGEDNYNGKENHARPEKAIRPRLVSRVGFPLLFATLLEVVPMYAHDTAYHITKPGGLQPCLVK